MKHIFTALLLLPLTLGAQHHDKGTFVERKPGYYQSILKGISEFEQTEKQEKKTVSVFKVDLTGMDLPTDLTQYKQVWHNQPISQGNTGTCWCFSTTSFYESEVKRVSGKEVKLSEIFSVYWQYVERARYFVQHRGVMAMGEGSETMAVGQMMKKYGAVPWSVYNGLKEGQKFHTHAAMYDEIDKYLQGVKARNAWNEEEVVATVRSIMDHHIGAVPDKFKYEGKEYTPMTFLNDYLKLNPDNYVDLMSLMSEKYWTKSEYKVPDNWWHGNNFMNVPLDDFMGVIKSSLTKGYSIAIGGDVSEAGLETNAQVGVVPTFDIPSEYIDENARAFRFLNHSTTDDHAMHIVGYVEKEGKTWYLIKDSSAGSRACGESCKTFGYYFFHEDYIKLKMMTMTVHKDMVKDLMKKMN